jgi:hypothetical protein
MSDSARRYVYQAGTASLGGQDTVNLDPFARMLFQATVCVDAVSGSLAGQLEVTFDDVSGRKEDIRWVPYTDAFVLTASTPRSTAISTPEFPAKTTSPSASIITINDFVTACRLRIDRFDGAVNFTVIQGLAR